MFVMIVTERKTILPGGHFGRPADTTQQKNKF